MGNGYLTQSGVYILHTDNPKFSAVVAMPRTKAGTLVPYQEHPQTYPLELKLKYKPERDRGLFFRWSYRCWMSGA